MDFFGATVKSFNLEITNKCTLGCSACARTGNAWIAANLADLPVSLIERAFPLEERGSFAGLRVNLCGSYGDCIYHRQFHDVLSHLKKAGIGINLETNGSHRKRQWWERTCELLTDGDVITFSVDGLEDTNHIYRVNARWSDIVQAMRVCAEKVTVDWKFIVFRHNEHQLEEAKALAAELGVRRITFKKSGRFQWDDPLAPQNEQYIGVVTRNRRRIGDLDAASLDAEVVIVPKCRSGKDLAITAHGHLLPCSPAGPGAPSGWFYENREHFDLRRHAVRDILASAKWRELETLWRQASTAPRACLEYCGVHRDYVGRYAETSRRDRPNKPRDEIAVTVAAR